jgi:hypothetical protein
MSNVINESAVAARQSRMGGVDEEAVQRLLQGIVASFGANPDRRFSQRRAARGLSTRT